MYSIDLENTVILIIFLVAHELIFRYMFSYSSLLKLRSWMNQGYPPLPPRVFSSGWIEDLRYFFLVVLIGLYSLCHDNDLMTLLIINVYLTTNTIIHLFNRFTKITKFINNLSVDLNGSNFSVPNKKGINWEIVYLYGMKKWIDAKIDDLNIQLTEGIKLCQRDKQNGLLYLDRLNIKFSISEWFSSLSQTLHMNVIFLIHVISIIVTNTFLLFKMMNSGIIKLGISDQYGLDAFYSILQIVTTIGFGDIACVSFQSQCFFIVIFLQVIVTIILGVAYKDWAMTLANEKFGKLTQLLNDIFDHHKNLCINTILTGKRSGYLEKDENTTKISSYAVMLQTLKEFLDKTNANTTLKSKSPIGVERFLSKKNCFAVFLCCARKFFTQALK